VSTRRRRRRPSAIVDFSFSVDSIENCNHPSLDALKQYDDGLDLSGYDFNGDGFSPLDDDLNKRKLAYRHRVVAQKIPLCILPLLDAVRSSGLRNISLALFEEANLFQQVVHTKNLV
ncbi:Eyes absent-like protein, partial [Drosera capensis]